MRRCDALDLGLCPLEDKFDFPMAIWNCGVTTQTNPTRANRISLRLPVSLSIVLMLMLLPALDILSISFPSSHPSFHISLIPSRARTVSAVCSFLNVDTYQGCRRMTRYEWYATNRDRGLGGLLIVSENIAILATW